MQHSQGAEPWQEALAQMPLRTNVTLLTKTNFADTVLKAFQSNATVKALILMPCCTDEFYFFNRADTRLTNAAPTLLDAVTALTNQTAIRATFRAPFLLLRTDEDPQEPLARVESMTTVEKLRQRRFLPHALFNDNDWDFMQPVLFRTLSSRFLSLPHFFPVPKTTESWHFYRHSFAAWNLDGWEALQAIALAGQTQFTVKKTRIVFEGDPRFGAEQRRLPEKAP
jgi:hypothetical protein